MKYRINRHSAPVVRNPQAGKGGVPANIAADLAALTERLHRACLTVQCLPADGPKSFFSTWPRYKLDWYDAEEWGSYRTDEALTQGLIAPPRFAPTPAEVDDCLPALALLNGLPWLCRRVVSLRAHQLWYGTHARADEAYAYWRGGWSMVARAAGLDHHEKAKRAHWRAVRTAYERNQNPSHDAHHVSP